MIGEMKKGMMGLDLGNGNHFEIGEMESKTMGSKRTLLIGTSGRTNMETLPTLPGSFFESGNSFHKKTGKSSDEFTAHE